MTWAGKNGGLRTTQIYAGFANGPATTDLALGGLQDNGTIKYTGSDSWFKVFGGDGGWCAISSGDENTLYEEYVYLNMYKSTDGGVSWVPKNYGLPGLNTYRLAIHPNDPNHLLVGFDGLTVAQGAWPYRSLDGAERWEPTFVCEREDGLVNLQTLHLPAKLKFDPTATNRLYYLMDTQTDACGGFYRSCDQGASYDRNPSCIPNPVPRPACAAGEPEPVNSIGANDADILEVDSRNGDLFGATGTHPEQSALQTSHNKGGEWFYDDVVDTRGYNLIPAPEQDPLGLYARTMVLAPSDPDARYAAIPGGLTACNDHLAHPVLCVDRRVPGPTNPRLVVRWFGEMSGATDCSGNNLCDGDAAPDRVWRPIFNGQNRPSALDVRTILVHSTDANRVFVAGDGGPNEVLMLTPGAPGTEWNQTTLYSDSTHYFDRLVQDPGNPDSFYLLSHSSGVPVRGVRIQRFRSTDNWQTWNRVDLAEYTDYFHVNDIAETRGSRGHRIAAATTNDLRVADELGAVWSRSGLYSMHHAALATWIAIAMLRHHHDRELGHTELLPLER